MNKQDLIEAVATAGDISKAAAGRAVDAVFENISESLKRGEAAMIIGFGTFDISNRAARTGRNPKSGEAIQIPASKVVRFKPGKALKDQVNK